MRVEEILEKKFEFSAKAEAWIKDNKAKFEERYGDDWKSILYATATKMQKEGKL